MFWTFPYLATTARGGHVANVVGERFQITIGRAAREALAVAPGDLAVERVEDGRLVVEFIPAPHNRSLRGILKGAPRPPNSTDSAAEKEAAWRVRSSEIAATLAADSRRHRARRARATS